MSTSSHSSSILPSRQRLIVRPVNATSRPVGGAPISSPSWRAADRVARRDVVALGELLLDRDAQIGEGARGSPRPSPRGLRRRGSPPGAGRSPGSRSHRARRSSLATRSRSSRARRPCSSSLVLMPVPPPLGVRAAGARDLAGGSPGPTPGASVGLPIRATGPFDSLAHRVRGRLGAAPQVELGEDARDVVLGGSPADVQALGDLRVRAVPRPAGTAPPSRVWSALRALGRRAPGGPELRSSPAAASASASPPAARTSRARAAPRRPRRRALPRASARASSSRARAASSGRSRAENALERRA